MESLSPRLNLLTSIESFTVTDIIISPNVSVDASKIYLKGREIVYTNEWKWN